MTVRWEDLDARARGLATHLLGPIELAALAQSPDLSAVGDALRRDGYPVAEGERSPEALELAVRRMAAARLGVLARWSGSRTAALSILFEDEDRRSLRAVLRGAVQGVPAEERLAGLVPTSSLPEGALRELARQDRPGAVASLLVAWGNPYGPALLPVASADHPDLFTLELRLNAAFAARATRAARGTGLLEACVREMIDIENAYAALVLASEGEDVTAGDTFLAGGERVSLEVFQFAAAAASLPEAARRLARAFSGSPLEPLFERYAGDPGELEDAVLRQRIRQLVQATRTEPLGPAPLLAYVLRVRAEVVDLRRIIWGVALGTPPALLASELVTA
ncbi:MAG TPA: V-type ATPase subunit [Gemmatimonadales bacterium]|nr:V-type ATPase subunit [Gemmatimonadales bacterium]